MNMVDACFPAGGERFLQFLTTRRNTLSVEAHKIPEFIQYLASTEATQTKTNHYQHLCEFSINNLKIICDADQIAFNAEFSESAPRVPIQPFPSEMPVNFLAPSFYVMMVPLLVQTPDTTSQDYLMRTLAMALDPTRKPVGYDVDAPRKPLAEIENKHILEKPPTTKRPNSEQEKENWGGLKNLAVTHGMQGLSVKNTFFHFPTARQLEEPNDSGALSAVTTP